MATNFYHNYEDLPDSERLEECPFNENHKVVAKRMQKHLIKCSLQYKAKGILACRFNKWHIYHKDKIEKHEDECPDRRDIERFLVGLEHAEIQGEPFDQNESGIESLSGSERSAMASSSGSGGPMDDEDDYYSFVGSTMLEEKPKFLNRPNPFSLVQEEDWDFDIDEQYSYHPQQVMENRKKIGQGMILQRVQHGTPAERKQLRHEQSLENKIIVNKLEGPKVEQNPSINYAYAAENYGQEKKTKKPKLEGNNSKIGGTAAHYCHKKY